jgi:DNA polymerase III alpha subunit (gram-positive type)
MFVVLDLETTGLLPREDAIIELAFVKISRDTFQEIDRISTFINPQRPIPQLISQITNIYDEDIEEAPIFSKISDEIQDFIE